MQRSAFCSQPPGTSLNPRESGDGEKETAAAPGADPVCLLCFLLPPTSPAFSRQPRRGEWRLKHETGDQGGEGEEDSSWLQNRCRLSRLREAVETSASGRAQCDGLAVIDLFPSPPPTPPPPQRPPAPFPAGYIAFPNWAQAGCNKELPLPHPRVPSPSVGASPRQKATVEGAD